ncbi:hypothetical protein HY949_04235 [Candidatus Gottesmanbacteria bacterium]|nr:hypothetical protein [Candidatus Gottesmanbacteria bacterium]
MKRHILPFILILFVSYWAIRPLVGSGYFPMHDDTQVARVIVMGRALLNGQFPVRLVSGLGYGYGYPLFNFYGPLPYYFGGGLSAVGVDPVVATKIMMAVGMVLAGISMYVFGAAVFGRTAGILAAALYVFAPYHAVLLFVRGAVGELWGYALLPIIFLGWYIGKNPKRERSGIWIGGLGLAGVILSHTITGYVIVVLYTVGLLLCSLIFLLKKKLLSSYVRFHALVLMVGLGLSAFFWVPAIIEMGYTNVADQIGGGADFRDHFVCAGQLWNSLWGFGGSVRGCIDGLSFKAGKLHIVLGIVGLLFAVAHLKKGFWNHTVGLLSLIAIGSVVMTTSFSRPVWEWVPGMSFIQYPWRFLSGIALSLSAVGASLLVWINNRGVRVTLCMTICIVVIITSAKLFIPQYMYEKPTALFESPEDISWRASRVSDEYLPSGFQAPASIDHIARGIVLSDPNGGLRVETEIDTETYGKLQIESRTSRKITLNRVYFPGWDYWVNGKRQEIVVENGLPVIVVPQGRSVVELRFGNTLPRIIGIILSIGILICFFKTYGKKAFT